MRRGGLHLFVQALKALEVTEVPEVNQPSITCPVCKRTSYHPKDIEHGWCGACQSFTRGA